MHQQTYKLAITNPCQEDWNGMNVVDGGRHCKQCSKNVIDFSTYSKQAIIDFFVANKGKSICGRMKKSQIGTIEIDRYLLDGNISFWKKFLIIFLIVFGYQLCGSSFVFAQVIENDSAKQEKMEIVDTLKIDTTNLIENKFLVNDSTTFFEKEREKIKDSIAQLKKEILSISLSQYDFKMPCIKLEDLRLEQMITGNIMMFPKDELITVLFPHKEIKGLIEKDKISPTISLDSMLLGKKINFPLNNKKKYPQPKNKNDYSSVFILPKEMQFKIDEEKGDI